MNAFTGEVELAWGEHKLTLVFNWRALGALRTLLGEGFMNSMDQALMNAAGDPEQLAQLVAIGLARHHPDLNAEAVMDLSPPIAVAVEAVGKALAFAFFGPKGPPKAHPQTAGK